jgi:hypothetical protein
VSIGEGESVFRCTPDESTHNPLGIVHGGLLCTLLDSAADWRLEIPGTSAILPAMARLLDASRQARRLIVHIVRL